MITFPFISTQAKQRFHMNISVCLIDLNNYTANDYRQTADKLIFLCAISKGKILYLLWWPKSLKPILFCFSFIEKICILIEYWKLQILHINICDNCTTYIRVWHEVQGCVIMITAWGNRPRKPHKPHSKQKNHKSEVELIADSEKYPKKNQTKVLPS